MKMLENNNEMKNVEEMVEVIEEGIIENGKNNTGTGVAVLIGAGVTVAIVGLVKLGKKIYGNLKAKKEAADIEVDLVDVSDDDIEN